MHSTAELAARAFTEADQATFAALSGDRNPMHMDALAARRVLSGAPVVHGVHTVLWMLDVLGERRLVTAEVSTLQVRFGHPINVGDTVTCVLDATADREVKAQALVDGVTAVTLKLGLGDAAATDLSGAPASAAVLDPSGVPVELEASDLEGRSGTIRFAADVDQFRNAFPAGAALIGAHRLRALAALSRLVGMECPGLHSIFAAIQVELTHAADGEVTYRVESAHPRTNLVTLAVEGGALTGRVRAFLRPKPVRQLGATAVRDLVTPDAYAGQHALIVGGSRGLGELAAKLVAAGGGSATITYVVGADDAAAVVGEIQAAGGSAAALRYDARSPAEPQLRGLSGLTHMYYFATPRISAGPHKDFDADAFDEYADMYVKAFYDLVTACRAHAAGDLRVCFPSTVFIDDSPEEFAEYVAAKAAGEALCAHITQHMPGVTALSARLPRMPTDQTASLLPVKTTPAIEVLQPLVERVQRGEPAPSA